MKMIVEYYKQYFLKLIILQIVFCLLIATFICVTSKEKQELAFDSKNLLGGIFLKRVMLFLMRKMECTVCFLML